MKADFDGPATAPSGCIPDRPTDSRATTPAIPPSARRPLAMSDVRQQGHLPPPMDSEALRRAVDERLARPHRILRRALRCNTR